MPLTITYTFAPLQIIFASRFNQNFSDIKSWADTHELQNSAVHGITGSFVDTGTANQVITAVKRADKLIRNVPLEAVNARFALSAGRLRLVGLDGNDPSVTNPVSFVVSDQTQSGLTKVITFTSTANSFIDDASTADSYFRAGAGTPWGTTAGVAWGTNMPLGIYVADTFSGPALFLSRRLNFSDVLAATFLGYKDNPPATPSYNNQFFFSTTLPTLPRGCWLIGVIDAQKSSSDDWTFQTTTDSTFGPLNFNKLNGSYAMPTGQNGAAAGSFFVVSAGTAPTYTSLSYVSYFSRIDGSHDVVYEHVNAAGGTAGAGANGLSMRLPVPVRFGTSAIPVGNFSATNNATQYRGNTIVGLSDPYSVAFEYVSTVASATAFITGADQNNATRAITGQLRIL